jgi:hypothetical protein
MHTYIHGPQCSGVVATNVSITVVEIYSYLLAKNAYIPSFFKFFVFCVHSFYDFQRMNPCFPPRPLLYVLSLVYLTMFDTFSLFFPRS